MCLVRALSGVGRLMLMGLRLLVQRCASQRATPGPSLDHSHSSDGGADSDPLSPIVGRLGQPRGVRSPFACTASSAPPPPAGEDSPLAWGVDALQPAGGHSDTQDAAEAAVRATELEREATAARDEAAAAWNEAAAAREEAQAGHAEVARLMASLAAAHEALATQRAKVEEGRSDAARLMTQLTVAKAAEEALRLDLVTARLAIDAEESKLQVELATTRAGERARVELAEAAVEELRVELATAQAAAKAAERQLESVERQLEHLESERQFEAERQLESIEADARAVARKLQVCHRVCTCACVSVHVFTRALFCASWCRLESARQTAGRVPGRH